MIRHRRIPSLMGTTALVGAALALTGPAKAQDYGLLWDGPGPLVFENPAGQTLSGALVGAYGRDGGLVLTNLGTIEGLDPGFAAVALEQAGSSVSNLGQISGAGFGIVAQPWYNPNTGALEWLTTDTVVTNAAGASIIGANNDGVRLSGGGSVTNAGTIIGQVGALTDGISIFGNPGQTNVMATVSNARGGTIEGARFGVILGGTGNITNAASGPAGSTARIAGGLGGILIQSIGATTDTGTVSNGSDGLVTGGTGVTFGGTLASSTLVNDGVITGTAGPGVSNGAPGALSVTNTATGSITGSTSGILAQEGAINVTNAGTIRGNGTYDGFEATPDGGISIGVGGSSITNSGSISGARFGITTYNYLNAGTGLLEPRATGTTVSNLAGGSIIGDGDDGVRLIGGGTVTNAGVIEGRNFLRADGVSMFALEGQDTTGQTGIGTVVNQAGGTIFGNRFGIGLSGGGTVENAGSILASDFSTGSLDGFGGGILFQAGATEVGKTGTLSNSGSITGGHGVIFGAFLASGSLVNSGTVTGTQSTGVLNTGANAVTIDNQAGGSITGARIGVWGQNGEVSVSNAGTITGIGGTDAAIVIEQAGSTVSNSGSIQGANFGIATNRWLNPATGLTEGLATGISVVNLAGGQIVGANNDGIRFNGSGTVSNAGVIEGRVNSLADGISISPFSAQDVLGDGTVGSVVNSGNGRIQGVRHGIIISGGGTVENGGTATISGNSYGVYLIGDGTVTNGIGSTAGQPSIISGNSGGVFIVATAGDTGRTGAITNLAGGVISGGNAVTFSGVLAAATLENAGVITGTGGSGVRQDSTASAQIDNLASGSITGATWGILGRNGAIVVDNAGSITGNGIGQAGIQIEQGNSSVSNSGLVLGANFGITANPWFNAGTGQSEPRAVGTLVENSGTIRGLNNDGVRLQGGGTITNSGLIEGLASVGADGISMFAHTGQDVSAISSIGTVNNLAGGTINGNRFGIILSTGGTVNNAGTIWAPDFNAQASTGFGGGIVIQDGTGSGGKIGTVSNSGSINAGAGISFGGGLVSSDLENSGSITARMGDGVFGGSGTPLAIDNLAGGSIAGGRSGIYVEAGALTLTNAGTIRGNGTNGSFNRTDAGVVIVDTGASVANSGTISGAAFGITTTYLVDAQGNFIGRAFDTLVSNSGTIRGDSNDGVRLVGGGTVTNSGRIEGLNNPFSDGVSMFRFEAQDVSARPSIGTVQNLAGGVIAGDRFGIILSGGGLIENDGTIRGNANGLLIQAGDALVPYTGTLINRGTIENGARFNEGVTISVANSGVISGNTLEGVLLRGGGSVTNSGSITSGKSGVMTELGALNLVNTGTIRGDGTTISANIPEGGSADTSRADGGVVIAAANSTVDNQGTISGRVHGIIVGSQVDAETGVYLGAARNTSITNSGLIRGETEDGIRLGGGGSVVNSGTIEGLSGATTDGISMFAFTGQDTSALPIIGSVTNLAGGTISGARIGVLMSKGGTVSNAGTISGGNTSNVQAGVIFQNATALAAQSASLTNSGAISGSQGVRLNSSLGNAAASIVNSGTITALGTTSSDGGIIAYSSGSLTVTNTASGIISGQSFGISSLPGALTVENAGQIIALGTNYSAIATSGPGARVTNSGLVSGENGISAFAPAAATEIVNSGVIRGTANRGVYIVGGGTITNLAGGTISGPVYSIELVNGGTINNAGAISGSSILSTGSLTFNNSGTINTGLQNYGNTATITNSGTIAYITSLGQTNLVNTGTIEGNIVLGGGLDVVTLGAGSRVLGITDAGNANFDRLRLDSGNAPQQTLGWFLNFEQLDLISGQWLAPDYTGDFDDIAISGGKLTLTGYIGGDVTVGSGGTFQLGTGGSVSGFDGNIVNDGQLIVDVGTNFDIGGDFSGTGSFTKDGAGTVSFLGDYGFTGITTLLAGGIRIAGAIDPQASFSLGAGTLDLSGSTGTTIAGLSGVAGSTIVLGSSSLTVNQDIDTVFAGSLSGTGSLIKDGDGRLNLTGTSTYTGPTIVSGGTLSVNGSIVSPVTIQSGATLGGTGTTGTVTIQSGGTFNPGNSIGTIRVAGNLGFATGSTFAVETNPTGASDLINVTGSVNIASGATVSVLAGSGSYRPSTKYVILTTTNKINGQFASVTSDLAFLEPKLSHSSKKVELTLKRRNISFASVAATTNQAAVAQAVETMGFNSALYDGVLNQNIAGARAAYETLSGGFFGDISNRLLLNGTRVQESLQDQAPATETGVAMWTAVESGSRTASGPEYRSGFSVARDGFQLSMVSGYIPFERVAFGSGGHASMETHYSGGAVGYSEDGLRLQAGIGFGWHDIRASRSIAFSGFSDQAETRYRMQTRQLFADVSYTHAVGALELSPFASLSSLHQGEARIQETPTAAALNVYTQDRDVMLASTGVRAGTRLELGGGMSLTPRATLGWQWARGDLGAIQQSQFASSGAAFVIAGDRLARSGLDVDAGFQLDAGRLSLTAGYRRNALMNGLDDGAELGLRIRF